LTSPFGDKIATQASNFVPISEFAESHREPTALSGRRRRSMRRACWRRRIDSHGQISKRSGPDVVRADDFASATRAAAAVGTTILLFALQINGSSRMEEKESLDNSRLKPKGSAKRHLDF
jgi:hypothetical protein